MPNDSREPAQLGSGGQPESGPKGDIKMNGSTWNIWDLHVHTPYSALNNQFGDPSSQETWQRYLSRLENAARARGVAAIGVTDYFTIEGYCRLLDYQRQGRLTGLLLIPNIEFRIDTIVYREHGAGSPKRLNLHALISPSVSPEEIQEHFLDDLEFVHEQEPFQRAQTRKLKRSNLESFGAALQEQHPPFRGRDPFEIGCLTAVVSADMVKERLDSRFHGRSMMILAEETLPLLDWDSQHHGIRKHLLQMAHAIFSSNTKTKEFCLGKTHDSVSEFKQEFKSLKPCLWGSDAHALDEHFLSPEMGRFCWIKGDVTWEGLRQVVFEPSERVAIQELSPEPTRSIFTLGRLQVAGAAVRPSLTIAPADVALNPNLVAIIGGRGTGKTALLDLLASCFPEGRKLRDVPASFFHRLYVDDPPPGQPPSQAIPVTLLLASGDSFAKQVGTDSTSLDNADVLYLTQNHFDEYSADPAKLNRHIIDIVFEHFPEHKRQLQELIDALNDHDRRLEELNLQFEHISAEVDRRKQPEKAELQALLGAKADIERQIAEIEATQGTQADEANALSTQLDDLLIRELATGSAQRLLHETKTLVDGFTSNYPSVVAELNTALVHARQGLQEGRIRLLSPDIPQLREATELIDTNLRELSIEAEHITRALATTRQRIADLQGLDKALADRREALSISSFQLQDVQRRITETSRNADKLDTIVVHRAGLFAEAMSLTVDYRQFLQSTIERFRAASPAALQNLQFDAVIDMSELPSYIEELALALDNRILSEADLVQILTPTSDAIRAHLQTGATNAEMLSDAEQLWSALAPLKTKKSVSVSEYANSAFRRFFRVGISLEYAGKRMVELSMGERAIILLKVLLALGDYPLLIDQPEEHLDNRFVFDDLTPAFREAKQRRQILIATHNANLVVNTDAEQIIIADNSDGVLSYRTGTLEDLGIREAIKIILEGGDEAFKKREERYGYMF